LLELRIVVTGTVSTAKDLEGIGYRAVHAEPALRRVMALLLRGEQLLWRRSGGKRWRPLDPDTRRRKRKTGKRPLVESGRLERSLTLPEATDAIREAHDSYLEFGTSVYYARFMQRGQGRRMPARPVLVYRPTDRTMSRKILLAHMRGVELPR
jgi:phage gpG-like protein